MKIPRVVIAGATSGVGKTSITCSVIHALRKRGLSVQPFKVGPDYIDPGYLSSVAGREAHNLDVWLMGRQQLLDSFVSNSCSDVSVIEGVMGYYDGHGGGSDHASTHHVASLTGSPAILVLDASKTSRSLAATALGFVKFHRNSRIAGIILNKLGSKRHEMLCREALAGLRIPIVGAIPRDPEMAMPSRHLGLVSTLGDRDLRRRAGAVARVFSKYLDVSKIAGIAAKAPPLQKRSRPARKKEEVVIAVALDTSFNFYYQDNLEALRRRGARLRFFSPVRNAKVPRCDGLYIGGGFPEILGGPLAKNLPMKRSIRRLAEAGLPVYAECGGLMYLTRQISSGAKRHKMVGLFDAETKMTEKVRLAYTKGTIVSPTAISARPRGFRGHEFHYSCLESLSSDLRFAYRLETGEGITGGRDGLVQDNTLASYGHLYFEGTTYADIFVRNCKKFLRR